MNDYVDSLVEWSGAREGWRPISRWSVAAWLVFYALFLMYAFRMHGGFLFIDSANLVVHEGGHMFFSWFGRTLCLWGGTILQWLVPLLLAAYFFHQRQPAAFIFCAFFFFENWLYTATYMADARAMALPLVTTGDSDLIEHDWNTIFAISFDHACWSGTTMFRRPRLVAPQMPVKELHDHIVSITGFGNVGVVKKTVKEPFPYV
jgi:hypothetical protein